MDTIIKIFRICTAIILLIISPIISLALIIIAAPLAFLGGGLKEVSYLLKDYSSSLQSVIIWSARLIPLIKKGKQP